MKPLRNPVVVGVLVVLAVAFVLHALRPQWRSLMPSFRGSNAAVVRAKTPDVPKPVLDPPAVLSAVAPAPVNFIPPLTRVESERWVESPRRDPFQNPNAANSQNSSRLAQKLTLSSILRQSGDSVAVINRQVVGEGDTVDGFRIDKIEADQVLVSGPNGVEAVGFPSDATQK